ncbi:MAG TPA: type II toxin-antitoxin system HicA family toxin [Ignavibacteria bacterium]|nr:type II toxin-antitoxin system HicA family toxin [Ignavibacteria bacterium]
MRLPRDISGDQLVLALEQFGYQVSRQKGSHIRLSKNLAGRNHHITIPNHSPIKIGTLNSIINDLASFHRLSKNELLEKLFD